MRISQLLKQAALPIPSLNRLIEEVEDWWDYASPGELKNIGRQLKLTTTDRTRWNRQDWQRVIDYYVRTMLGNPRGFTPSRNV